MLQTLELIPRLLKKVIQPLFLPQCLRNKEQLTMKNYVTISGQLPNKSLIPQCWQHHKLSDFLLCPNPAYAICITSRFQVFHTFIFTYLNFTFPPYKNPSVRLLQPTLVFPFLSVFGNTYATYATAKTSSLLFVQRTICSLSLYTLVSKCWVMSKHYRKQFKGNSEEQAVNSVIMGVGRKQVINEDLNKRKTRSWGR